MTCWSISRVYSARGRLTSTVRLVALSMGSKEVASPSPFTQIDSAVTCASKHETTTRESILLLYLEKKFK